MTVRKIAGGLVECEWFKDSALKKASFEQHSLQLAIKTKSHEERLEEVQELLRDGQ
jgi:uncharacterized protein YodC (DUF2158 family)